MSSELFCDFCGAVMNRVRCEDCEDGYVDHDCGEDCCACLHPELNVPCDICEGRGHYWECPNVPHTEDQKVRVKDFTPS